MQTAAEAKGDACQAGAWAASAHSAVDSSCLVLITSTLVLQIFKKVGLSAIRLLFIPGVVEAFFDGALAIAFFKMPATFAFALGFILKAVGPALVIQCMFEVQQKRLGVAKCEDVVCNATVSTGWRPSVRRRAASACSAASCLACIYMMRIRTLQHCCCASLCVQHVEYHLCICPC